MTNVVDLDEQSIIVFRVRYSENCVFSGVADICKVYSLPGLIMENKTERKETRLTAASILSS